MKKTLWELLWDYDPNGLIVLDPDMTIKVVNPAFCQMFRTTPEALIGKEASILFDDLSDFKKVWETGEEIVGLEREYPLYGLYVRKLLFSIHEEDVVACIMVNLTSEWQQRNEMLELKKETILNVHNVVEKQMKVAQKIASLLGETTAETKVSLEKLLDMVEKEG
jgi:PAS domain-containing protein